MVRSIASRLLGATAALLVAVWVLGGVWVLLTSLSGETAVGLFVVAAVVGATLGVGRQAGGDGRTPYW